MDILSNLISFLLGILASIIANFLIQPISFLFLPRSDRWKGEWHGTAEDIIIEEEKDLDNRGLKQDVKIKIVRTGKKLIKVDGAILFDYDIENDPIRANIKGSGKVYDGNYSTVYYELFLESSVGFGVALLQISSSGTMISGHFLSRRIAEQISVKPRAFGKVHLKKY
ncbi:hypothetical protein GMMP13_1500005 [Candidatus Magnetomoraceae bacterium gMMP-13]